MTRKEIQRWCAMIRGEEMLSVSINDSHKISSTKNCLGTVRRNNLIHHATTKIPVETIFCRFNPVGEHVDIKQTCDIHLPG